jgi:hypothetical protein
MRNKIILFCILCINTKPLTAQAGFPPYKDVLEKFFADYSFITDGTEGLNFAKKKNGWYAEVLDLLDSGKAVKSELLWSFEKKSFQSLSEFPDAVNTFSTSKVAEKLGTYDDYAYERCQYYGYNEWDEDMINDFGNSVPKNDTLLEGLARAYSNYAGRYLWFQTGGIGKQDDSLQRKLKGLDIPSPQRLEKVRFYSLKAIGKT